MAYTDKRIRRKRRSKTASGSKDSKSNNKEYLDEVNPSVVTDENAVEKAEEDANDARNDALNVAAQARKERLAASGKNAVKSPKSGRMDALLEEEVMSSLLDSLLAGNTIANSCRIAGVSLTPFYRWMAKGETQEEEYPESPEVKFYLAVKKAKARAEHRNVMVIQKASQKTWQAAAWWLERTNHKDWGRKDSVSLGGDPDASPILHGEVSNETLSDEEALESLKGVLGNVFKGI